MPDMTSFPPEKQRLFEKAFQVGKNIIYDEQTFSSIIQEVDKEDPVKCLSEAIVNILGAIEMDQSIGQLPIDVALTTGLTLLGDLVDALQKTGRGPFPDDLISKALDYGVRLYLHLNSDRIDPQELQNQMQQLQRVVGGGQ